LVSASSRSLRTTDEVKTPLREDGDPRSGHPEQHARAAREAWARAQELLAAGRHRVVVLDELTHVLVEGYVSCDEVLAGLSARAADTTVVVTGRYAPVPLLDAADLVTEMRAVRHPFSRGMKALPGIDY